MPGASESRSTGAAPRAAPQWLAIDVTREADGWSEATDALVEAAASALAGHPQFTKSLAAEACIALSDDAAVRNLNGRYRGKDKPTNVLSFPAAQSMPGRGGAPRALGDVVLARETVEREAAEQGLPVAAHVQHLVVHGLLHLLGFDHETEADAAEMERLEIEILAMLGLPNPYAHEVIATLP